MGTDGRRSSDCKFDKESQGFYLQDEAPFHVYELNDECEMRTSVSLTDNSPLLSLLRGIAVFFGVAVMVGLLGGIPLAQAQAQGPSLQSDRQPIRVSVDPTYQYYETGSGRVLTQLSTYLSAYVPVTQQMSVSARMGYARMGGDDLTQIQGPTDVSGRVSYAQPVGEGSVVFQVLANAPTGKQNLTGDEVATTRPISQNFYDFRVSSFSRGTSIAPQVTWAVPVSDRVVVGIGGSYQHQRGFQPQAGFTSDSLYTPGDGVKVNGGVDYKITDGSAIGVNGTFRRYQEDEVKGEPRFDAGNQFSGTLRYLRQSGFTSIRVVARYSTWEESQFGFRDGGFTDQGQVLPPHGMLLGSYSTRLTDAVGLDVRTSGHWYGETLQSDRKIFGRLYLSPSFELHEMLTLAPHATATYGSYLGLGGGVRVVGSF